MARDDFDFHLTLHGLAIRHASDAAGIAALTGLPPEVVQRQLDRARDTGRVALAAGRCVLTLPAQLALRAEYSRFCGELRRDAAMLAAYADFERVNTDLKRLITDWQTVEVAGTRVVNDHTDRRYDDRVVDRLADLHERAEPVLERMANVLPRLRRYGERLGAALEHVLAGDGAWVSEVQRPSYHTVWFELHEDLLRCLGRSRED